MDAAPECTSRTANGDLSNHPNNPTLLFVSDIINAGQRNLPATIQQSSEGKGNENPIATLLTALGIGEGEIVSLFRPKSKLKAQTLPAADLVLMANDLASIDAWFGVNPLKCLLPRSRKGKVSDVARLACLHADLDIKPGGLAGLDQARVVIDRLTDWLGAPPTAVVMSGHGLHPYWRITDRDGNTRCDTPEHTAVLSKFLRRWGEFVEHAAQGYGMVDSVFNLDRVMRLPGTTNCKDPAHPILTTLKLPGGKGVSFDDVLKALDARLPPDRPSTNDSGALKAPVGARTSPAAYDALDAPAQHHVHAWLRKAVQGTKRDLRAASDWPEGHRDDQGRGWEKLVADCAFRFGRLARSDWTPWTMDDARQAFEEVVPPKIAHYVDVGGKWRDQANRGDPRPIPKSLRSNPEGPFGKTADAGGKKDPGEEKVPGAKEIIDYVRNEYRLGVTPNAERFAVPRSGPKLPVMLGTKGGSLRDEVTLRLFEETDKVVSAREIDSAMRVLVAEAGASPVTSLHLRIAEHEGSLLLDLGLQGSGKCVQVTADGWEVLENPPGPVVFKRTAASRPLPEPSSAGDLGRLNKILMLDERHWALVKGWLAAAMFPSIPRPMLALLGPAGSAKSTRGLLVLSVLDPRSELGSSFGKSADDDQVKALNRYLVGLDNITSVSAAVSDHLSRLVTGDEVAKRVLYSDEDLLTRSYRRTGLVTAISMPALRPDALERIVPLFLQRVPETERRSESAIAKEFAEAHPIILGGLLDLVASTLSQLPGVRSQERSRPRMADFDDVLTAADPALSKAYTRACSDLMTEAAEDNPFVVAVRAWIGEDTDWTGTATQALQAASDRNPGSTSGCSWWPKTARAFSAALDENAGPLRAVGLQVERLRSSQQRLLTIRRCRENGPEPADPNGSALS